MRNALERAKAAGCSTLVFTVDMPVPGARYRDAHSGMSGKCCDAPLYAVSVSSALVMECGLNGSSARFGKYL